MERIIRAFGGIGGGLLVASAIIAFLGIVGIVVAPELGKSTTDMHIEPPSGQALVGKTTKLDIVVHSDQPVNVFAGELDFDPSILVIDSIDYNTSIADLWAEEPWYSNGDGTLTFGGGTTRSGGFIGTGSLITVTFKTLRPGNAALTLNHMRILRYDGKGTDVPLADVVNADYTVTDATSTAKNLVTSSSVPANIAVRTDLPSPDLNGDGAVNLADVSTFFIELVGQNKRADLNGDGAVDTKDLSILMSAL